MLVSYFSTEILDWTISKLVQGNCTMSTVFNGYLKAANNSFAKKNSVCVFFEITKMYNGD